MRGVQQFRSAAGVAAQAGFGGGEQAQQTGCGDGVARMLLADQPLPPVEFRVQTDDGQLVAEPNCAVHVAEGGVGEGRAACVDGLAGQVDIQDQWLGPQAQVLEQRAPGKVGLGWSGRSGGPLRIGDGGGEGATTPLASGRAVSPQAAASVGSW